MRFDSTLVRAFAPLQAFLPSSLSVIWNYNIKSCLKEYDVTASGFYSQYTIQWQAFFFFL
jgi:hypothetical protein